MKLKIALGITVALIMNANVFAIEIYKGHVISQKEWTTGGNFKFNFADAKSHSSLAKRHLNRKDGGSTIDSSYVEAESTTGSVNTPTLIQGESSTQLYNFTSTSQTYSYVIEDCLTIGNHNTRCAVHEESIQLDPDGYAIFNHTPTLQLTFTTPGTYISAVSSDVSGSDGASYSNDANGTVMIS